MHTIPSKTMTTMTATEAAAMKCVKTKTPNYFIVRMLPVLIGLAVLSGPAAADKPRRIVDGDIVEVAPRPPGTPLVLYVNGIDVTGAQAVLEAEEVARSLGSATLIYNDCSKVDPRRNSYRDIPAMLISKGAGYFLDKRVNKAVPSLMRTLRGELAAGREVHLVTFSMGSMIALNVLNELEDSLPPAERARKMGLIRWVSVGGAVFGPGHTLSDGYPQHLGGLVRIDDARDQVSAVWGGLDFALRSDPSRHLMWNYGPHLSADLFDGRWGQLVTDGPRRVLLDEWTKAPPGQAPRIRVLVFPIPGQKSRATMNFHVPRAWGQVSMTIVQGNRGQRFTWLQDRALWPDRAVSGVLSSGSVTRVDSGHYLARIDWDPAAKEQKRQPVKREFWVEIRPVATK